MKKSLSRRDFLKYAGVTSAGILGTFALASCSEETVDDAETESKGDDETKIGDVVESNDNLVNKDAEETGYIRPDISFDMSTFNVNPLAIRGAGQVTYSVYEMLYQTENGIGSSMVPVLADANRGGNNSLGLKGMDHEDDSTEYTFYIYDYVTDSAGNKITADDVVFSFEKTRDYGQVSGWGAIDGWEAVDNTTVKMTTNRELNQKGEIENILLRCYVFSQKAFEESESEFNTDACGTGPYVITDFVQDAYITCETREDYWQTDDELRTRSQEANVTKFTANVISDSNTKITAIQSGDIDMISNISATNIGQVADDSRFEIYSYPANGMYYIDLNVNEASIMSDPNMRLAVYYAISNENLANILNAAGLEAYYPLTAYGHDLFSDYLTKWDAEENYVTEYSLEKSKEYADKAGYNGEKIYFLNANDTTGIVENLQNMLINAGFNVELKSYDRNTVTGYRDDPSQWDIYFNMTNSSDYTTSLWSHVMDAASFGGHTENFIDDDVYNELLSSALEVSATDDDLDAFWQYTIEHAYFYPLVRTITAMVLPAGEISNVWLNDKNSYTPGASYYSEV